jgi:protoporphyrin/coproporphyrin ferrochelatase
LAEPKPGQEQQMIKLKKGVLLVNLGTPDSPQTPDVRKYLREFLMDGRVIDIPYVSRFFLVNGIIAPFRAPKSAKIYKKLWNENGSPLLYYGIKAKEQLQKSLGENYEVKLAMRYQTPSIETALEEFKKSDITEIIVLPLFPQYASASTGSVIEKVMDIIGKWQIVPSIKFINSFYNHPAFINAWYEVSKKYMDEKYDHYIFSYHGLPERQILKGDCHSVCKFGECCNSITSKNYYCYRANCFETTRLLASKLGIDEKDYTVCFQSRLGNDPWIKPYSDDVIKELPKKGKKKVLAFSPAFIADCLETTIEVGEEYKEIFEEHGGEEWQLVESLNDSPAWIDCLVELVK